MSRRNGKLSALTNWRYAARRLKVTVFALYLAYRDPRVPWYARLWCLCLVGYALSPIDLIPDPIPVLGQLDDLILIPLGVVIAMRMIPATVMADCTRRAEVKIALGNRAAVIAAIVVVSIWIMLAAAVVAALWQLY